jgi:hypothetical protein
MSVPATKTMAGGCAKRPRDVEGRRSTTSVVNGLRSWPSSKFHYGKKLSLFQKVGNVYDTLGKNGDMLSLQYRVP